MDTPLVYPNARDLTVAERLVIDAAGVLAAAEQAEAEAFLVRKYEQGPKVRSDWEARAMAAIDTNSGVTQARAAYDIALNRLRREGTDASER